MLGQRGEEVIEAGGAVVEVLLDAGIGEPPTEEELTAWIEAYSLTVTTVGRVDARTREVFSDREYAYIIDLETMQVVWQTQALFSSPTITELGIDKILLDYL